MKQEHLDGKEVELTEAQQRVFYVVLAVELLLMLIALFLAIRCGRKHQDMFLHIIVALMFPVIYIMYYLIAGCGGFEGCA